MAGRLEDFIDDAGITIDLIDTRNRIIMVIGGSDTGKTTLIACLCDLLSRQGAAAIVDLDVGQSHIGPPTTIAWGRVEGGFREWSDIAVEDFYFTGTITPMGSLLSSIVGARMVTERAVSSCEKVLIDTSGLIAEPAGRVLKQFKIDVIFPDIIIGLEHSGELAGILDAFRFHKRPKVLRLSVPPQTESRSPSKRNLHRFEKITEYFNPAEIREVSLRNVGIRFTGDKPQFSGIRNRIVSFRDEMNRDMALGIVEEVILRDDVLLINTPLEDVAKASAIVVGRTEVDRDKRELRERRISG
ncbi:MAG TPA: Clp1/GlmU family protein [Thermodesulfovibrionales bacterium]|nr:Clp1/GlmU family protein [Thermodesulfovibrionales bacterium]